MKHKKNCPEILNPPLFQHFNPIVPLISQVYCNAKDHSLNLLLSVSDRLNGLNSCQSPSSQFGSTNPRTNLYIITTVCLIWTIGMGGGCCHCGTCCCCSLIIVIFIFCEDRLVQFVLELLCEQSSLSFWFNFWFDITVTGYVYFAAPWKIPIKRCLIIIQLLNPSWNFFPNSMHSDWLLQGHVISTGTNETDTQLKTALTLKSLFSLSANYGNTLKSFPWDQSLSECYVLNAVFVFVFAPNLLKLLNLGLSLVCRLLNKLLSSTLVGL